MTTLDAIKMASRSTRWGRRHRSGTAPQLPPFSTGETGQVGSPSGVRSGTAHWPSGPLVPVLPSVSCDSQVSGGSGQQVDLDGVGVRVDWRCSRPGCRSGAGGRHRDGASWSSDDIQVEGAVDGVVERRFVTLTDILGAEDAFGDMDSRCAGTKDFVTARCSWTPSSTGSAAGAPGTQAGRTPRLRSWR